MIGHALPVYQGYRSQYGHGLGNVLGGVMRAAIPFVSKLAKKKLVLNCLTQASIIYKTI